MSSHHQSSILPFSSHNFGPGLVNRGTRSTDIHATDYFRGIPADIEKSIASPIPIQDTHEQKLRNVGVIVKLFNTSTLKLLTSTKIVLIFMSVTSSVGSLIYHNRSSNICHELAARDITPAPCTLYTNYHLLLYFFAAVFGLTAATPVLLSPHFCYKKNYYFGLLTNVLVISESLFLLGALELAGVDEVQIIKRAVKVMNSVVIYLLNAIMGSLQILGIVTLLFKVVLLFS